VRVEEGTVDGDAMLLHPGPGGGVGIYGGDVLFELVIETGNLGTFGLGVVDGPARDTLGAALDPPAVKDGERRYTIQRGLHAGGS